MKKIFIILLFSIAFKLSNAQDSVSTFSPYKINIAGSAVQTSMVPVPAGDFLMGSSDNDKLRQPDESPRRSVTLDAFWMGAYEVTRDQFDLFFKDENTSLNSSVDAITRPSPQYIDFSLGMGKEGGYPVNSLSQYSALMYCRWLYNKTGFFYRLPTEAEWEYACKAGSTGSFYFGDDEQQLEKYAWFKKNSNSKFQKTGLKLPNAWGLYDMLGNVSEWTLDHYEEKRLEAMPDKTANPFVAPNRTRYPKALRGGGYLDEAAELRSANRIKSDPAWNRRDPQIPRSKWWLTDGPAIGFRIVRPLKQPAAAEVADFFQKYLGN